MNVNRESGLIKMVEECKPTQDWEAQCHVLEDRIRYLEEQLKAEVKLVNHYAENGYSYAVKRVKERPTN